MGGVHSSGCRGDDYRTVSVWVGSLFGETDCTSELNIMMCIVRNGTSTCIIHCILYYYK